MAYVQHHQGYPILTYREHDREVVFIEHILKEVIRIDTTDTEVVVTIPNGHNSTNNITINGRVANKGISLPWVYQALFHKDSTTGEDLVTLTFKNVHYQQKV